MPSENSPPPPTRWCGLGSADASDVDPGASAAEQALLHDDPKLVIVFCSEALDLEAALRAIRSRIDAPLIGCTTAGEIATTGPRDASIVVTVFGGDGFAVDTSFAEGASHDLRAAGAKAARCIPGSDAHPHRVLLLLTDGLAGRITPTAKSPSSLPDCPGRATPWTIRGRRWRMKRHQPDQSWNNGFAALHAEPGDLDADFGKSPTHRTLGHQTCHRWHPAAATILATEF